MTYWYPRDKRILDTMAHFAYAIVRLQDHAISEAFYRWHPDLTWC